jgi:hypothetical protein
VKEFDDIYNKKIAKRYAKHELQRLSSKRKDRQRATGAGRPFKLNVKKRFLMILMYYPLKASTPVVNLTITGCKFNSYDVKSDTAGNEFNKTPVSGTAVDATITQFS